MSASLEFRGLELVTLTEAPNAGKNGLTQAIGVASAAFRLPKTRGKGHFWGQTITPPAPVAALAGAGAGNVDNGTHSYKFVKLVPGGKTLPGAASNIVTTNGGNGKVNVTLPGWTETNVYGMEVYRTVAGNAAPWKLLTTTYEPSGGTYLDNTADAGLGADAPSTDTTSGTSLLWKPRQIIVVSDIAFCYRLGATSPTAVVTDKYVGAGTQLYIPIADGINFMAVISADGVATGTLWYSVTKQNTDNPQ
jgi:hypothetical protein